MNKGKFIVLEGPEGVGKSTQIKILSDRLTKEGIEHITTREPGGSPICSKIRNVLLDPENKNLTPKAELFLYIADREQHIDEVIKPALESGVHVLCDRYSFSTIAYQGYGRGLGRFCYSYLHLIEGIEPDLAILLDGDVSECLSRAKSRGDNTRFEMEEIAFHEKIRQGFLDQFKGFTRRKIINVTGKNIEQVHEEVYLYVQTILKGDHE